MNEKENRITFLCRSSLSAYPTPVATRSRVGEGVRPLLGQALRDDPRGVVPSHRTELPNYRSAADRRSIHLYNKTIAPTKPSSPSHSASSKSSGTIPIGASFDRLTIRPALITPHKLSPTINPDATSVPSRGARSTCVWSETSNSNERRHWLPGGWRLVDNSPDSHQPLHRLDQFL